MKFYDREKEKKVLGEVLLQSKHEDHWNPTDFP